MASIFDPNLDDEQKKEQMGVGVPTAGNAPAAAPNRPSGSGLFTNLQSYIRANQGTDAGQQAKEKVLGASDSDVQASNSSYEKLQGMSPGTGPASMKSDDQSWLESMQPDTNPAPQAQNAEPYRQRFDNLFSQYGQGPGTYQGPSAQDFTSQGGTAAQNLQKAQTSADILRGDNQTGRQQTLRGMYGQDGNYTNGQGKLDSFLLERNYGPEMEAKYQAIQSTLGGRGQAIQDQTTQKATQATQTQQAFGDTQSRWRSLLQGADTTVRDAEDRAAHAKAASPGQGSVGAGEVKMPSTNGPVQGAGPSIINYGYDKPQEHTAQATTGTPFIPYEAKTAAPEQYTPSKSSGTTSKSKQKYQR